MCWTPNGKKIPLINTNNSKLLIVTTIIIAEVNEVQSVFAWYVSTLYVVTFCDNIYITKHLCIGLYICRRMKEKKELQAIKELNEIDDKHLKKIKDNDSDKEK